MIAAPYTKLLTSNVDVDQAAVLVVCGYAASTTTGVSKDHMVFLLSGAGASEHEPIRARLQLDRSHAMTVSATAFDLVRGTAKNALLHANGGYFSKQGFVVLSGRPPSMSYTYERPQEEVDACQTRPLTNDVPAEGTIEAYIVTYSREGEPTTAILSILETDGARHWAHIDGREEGARDDIERVLTKDGVSWRVTITPSAATPTTRLAS